MHGACSAHCDCLSSTGPPEFEDQCESAMQEVLLLASWFDSTEIAETRKLILHLKSLRWLKVPVQVIMFYVLLCLLSMYCKSSINLVIGAGGVGDSDCRSSEISFDKQVRMQLKSERIL
ncbi:hypothetical protein Peur_003842 [Populus x canadensis]